MLANQNLLIETMQQNHKDTEQVLAVLTEACATLNLHVVSGKCDTLRVHLKDTGSMFQTLRAASTSDLSEALGDVKKFALEQVAKESRDMQADLKKSTEASAADITDRFKKLESRVLSELAGGEDADSRGRLSGRGGDSQLLKKVTNRIGDFESQVTSQLAVMSQDIEKKIAFLGSQRGPSDAEGPAGGMDAYRNDMDSLKYDIGELKDMVNGAKTDTAHVKRVVLACERDMEDFTAAMDAVNVDLDEMRARVDSTHSIITSRQRVEATVTAEISTMRLDMGDMQEALKSHDAWMEDVSQSLQEAHERSQQLGEDMADLREQTQAKLDAKTDVAAWNDMNDDIDASVKTVRDMASALRLEVDSRRRKVDDNLSQIRVDLKEIHGKIDGSSDAAKRSLEETMAATERQFKDHTQQSSASRDLIAKQVDNHNELQSKIEQNSSNFEIRIAKLEADLRKQDEDMHKEVNERIDGVERHHTNVSKDTSKRLNALDLRISGLQGASGECKRDINKIRDEVNSLTVKSAAHDVDIGKTMDDLQKLERARVEDNQRNKQDADAIYEELDQKVYEKSFQGLEDCVTKLTRGTVKLCQVVGVFPGARMNDGTEEELDVDVELLNWEDCAQNLTVRVEKSWRQASSQKYRSILDLVSKKADHSVLRLLQISQQHIEGQLDRVRHERELWKEVVDKRAQQPLQLALTLKDPHTGQPLPPGSPGGMFMPGVPTSPPMGGFAPRPEAPSFQQQEPPRLMGPPPPLGAPAQSMVGPGDQAQMKAGGPLAKRIGAKPPPPSPQRG
jgi:predicted  nucleic acid-binding Zn-ribbon protein